MVLPMLKWAGGKRWLANGNRLPVPPEYDRYVEPFVGSGAVFFHLEPATAILADLNPELINLYEVTRDQPAKLWRALVAHQIAHSSQYYYGVRSAKMEGELERAARFLYLNRTCWNGLYRVNKKGEFNVPIGTKQAVIMASDNFEETARLLRRAEIYCADFEDVVDKCSAGDFLFVDPPYTAKHNFNGFLKYNELIFGWSDQLRLHAALRRAADRGARVCVTNANHSSLRELYEDFELVTLTRHSVLAGKSDARGSTTEAMFTANISTDATVAPVPVRSNGFPLLRE